MKKENIFIWIILILILIVPFCFKAQAYEQQYQVGDTGENGGTIISVNVQEELSEVITEVIGDFIETTEVWTYTETYVEEVENITYETVTTTTEVKTDNLLDEYTDTNINVVGNSYGMTGAEITTGNQSQGGGSRVYDLEITQDNIQEIEYGSTVYSHSSNTSVPLCANTTSDCKDEFKITVNLYKDGELKESYTHNYQGIDWSGSKDYSFNQDVSQISFNEATIEYYGIDRGFYSGYYGVGFSDMFFNLTYNQITEIINQIVNKIEYTVKLTTDEYIYSSEYIPPPPQPDVIEIEFDSAEEPIVIELDSFTEDFTTEIPVVEEIQEIEVVEMQEMEEIEIDIEIEIEQEMEVEIEPEEETQEQETEQEPQQEIKTKEIKQKIANKLMAKQSDKMSAQSQTTQLALMVILSDLKFDDLLATELRDTQFYQDVPFYEYENMIIDTQAGILGYIDYGMINEMVDSQWK